MGPSSASAGADELLRGTPSAYGELLRGHCSDVSAVAAGGWGEGFAHGHSEDWSEAVGELYYYVKWVQTDVDARTHGSIDARCTDGPVEARREKRTRLSPDETCRPRPRAND